MDQALLITFHAEHAFAILSQFAKLTRDAQCTVQRMRYRHLFDIQAGFYLVRGPWHQLEKVELGLKLLEKPGVHLTLKRLDTAVDTPKPGYIPYWIGCNGPAEPDLLYHLTVFCKNKKIVLVECNAAEFTFPTTQATMLNLNAQALVPQNSATRELRDQFFELCDELNLDGIFEPERPQMFSGIL